MLTCNAFGCIPASSGGPCRCSSFMAVAFYVCFFSLAATLLPCRTCYTSANNSIKPHVSCRQPVGLIELFAVVEHVLQGQRVAACKKRQPCKAMDIKLLHQSLVASGKWERRYVLNTQACIQQHCKPALLQQFGQLGHVYQYCHEVHSL